MITVCARENDGERPVHCHLVSFEKGSTIYHEGDTSQYWFEVVSGIVRTCRFLSDGHRQLTGFFYSGDVFGVEAPRYLESAEAVTGILLRRFPASPAHGSDAAGEERERILEKALDNARRCIFLFGHRTAANRVAAFLIASAARSRAKDGVELPMTRSDIADHLNLTLHTVSRTISDLARQGLIACHGPQTIRILNSNGLRIAAGDGDSAPARRIA